MEESGHYYTVYFTSLAVGFDKDIAYRHAVMAQMPDEVGYLDAANIHIKECLRIDEFDLGGHKKAVDNTWRFMVEYALHSLPEKNKGNKSSEHQRKTTYDLLMKKRPDTLEFGFLLHRLGDSFAHSMIDHEESMYTTMQSGSRLECVDSDSMGHARHWKDPKHDMDDPDYPFLRPGLFFKYLNALYEVLHHKISEKSSVTFKRNGKGFLFNDLKYVFNRILDDPHAAVPVSINMGLTRKTSQFLFIQKIRESSIHYLGIKMAPYAPEKIGLKTLREFLLEHDELLKMGVNEKRIIKAISSINDEI